MLCTRVACLPRFLQASVATNVVCIMADGMDQSKFKLPRVVERSSKLLQRLFRPTLHVSATWCHGYRLTFFVSDEELKKDSETQLEVLSRSISGLFDQFKSLPMGCVVQQDNCFREGKNRWVLSYAILMVALRVFRWFSCNYLRTGHSHSASHWIV